ncbi:MAG TPA: sulfite oxidase-like oxidoreductase [Gemmatimonadaceae bacterium]|nr:sulfite oxidase-like oxidoreductase [Gemmatimonadaceae bacterium]
MADKPFIARGFQGRRAASSAGRLPPGQYETRDFPVLSAGPTPRVPLNKWDFTIRDTQGRSVRWSWEEFQALPHDKPTVDIHCVTKWSKFDTTWEGISVDTLLDAAKTAGLAEGAFVVAFCDGGYTTNLPIDDVSAGKAWVAFGYDGAPLPPEHGGPARLLVPHLYFWKSAKWVRGLQLLPKDQPGFWEQLGYHDRGDPWQEQRYQGDP